MKETDAVLGVPSQIQPETDAVPKLDPPQGLTPDQLKVWNAACDPKNAALEKANLSGKDLVRWKFQRYLKDYLHTIDSVDDAVGDLLHYLDESGLAKNSIVIYSSDQGFYLGEHGWFNKRWICEEDVNEWELIDLKADPLELKNFYGD